MKAGIGENSRSCFATSRSGSLPDGSAKRSVEAAECAPVAAWIVAGLPTASALSADARVDHLCRRPARLQLLPRIARDAAGVAHQGPVQPVLPAAGDGRS